MPRRLLTISCVVAALAALLLYSPQSQAETAAKLEKDSRAALASLLGQSPAAKVLADESAAVLVFPEILKGGLIIGGQYGEGALFESNAVAGYYSTTAASFGLQAGLQKFGYAVFFVDENSLKYLESSEGWEIGSAPSLVVVDEGISGSLSSTTLKDQIYVFFFDQQGLMGGLGIQGTKITKHTPE